jgi:hypothetical protein
LIPVSDHLLKTKSIPSNRCGPWNQSSLTNKTGNNVVTKTFLGKHRLAFSGPQVVHEQEGETNKDAYGEMRRKSHKLYSYLKIFSLDFIHFTEKFKLFQVF